MCLNISEVKVVKSQGSQPAKAFDQGHPLLSNLQDLKIGDRLTGHSSGPVNRTGL
jgi:hypothetical protein